MMWFVMAAWGGDLPELTVEAVAVGDVTCSGGDDVVTLYSTEDGEYVVDVAIDLSKDDHVEPFSSSNGAILLIEDVDGDRCDDLVFGGEVPSVLMGGEPSWLLPDALAGAGDTEPDINVSFRKEGKDMRISTGSNSCVDNPPNCIGICTVSLDGPFVCGTKLGGGPLICDGWHCAHQEYICFPT